MAKTQTDVLVPGRVGVHSTFKSSLFTRPTSQPQKKAMALSVTGTHKAPATTPSVGRDYHYPMVKGKKPSSARSERVDGHQRPTAAIAKVAPLHRKTGTIKDVRDSTIHGSHKPSMVEGNNRRSSARAERDDGPQKLPAMARVAPQHGKTGTIKSVRDASQGYHNPMVEGKKNHYFSARVERHGDPHSFPAMSTAAASEHGKTATTRNVWNAPQSLITLKTKAATTPASLVHMRKGSPNLMMMKKREASSPPTGATGAIAKAAASKANSAFATGHPNYVKRLSPNRGQKRGSSHVFEDPKRPSSLHKKARYEPSEARRAVEEGLRMFRELAMKLQRDKETKPDMKAFKILKESGRTPTRKCLGEVPGVEVGDEFYYRSELMVAGLHGTPIAGIDSMPFKGSTKVATCVISSKAGYINVMEGSDVLVYSGEGGNPSFESARKGPAGDQRLERGNLALKNSMDVRTPVRVVHGFTVPRSGGESLASQARTAVRYVYDGVYQVEDYWWETGPKGFRVLKFQMRRLPGQPKLELKGVWRARAAAKRAVAPASSA